VGKNDKIGSERISFEMTEAYLSEGRICFGLIVVDETTWVRNVNIIRNGTCLRGMYLPLSGPEVACIP